MLNFKLCKTKNSRTKCYKKYNNYQSAHSNLSFQWRPNNSLDKLSLKPNHLLDICHLDRREVQKLQKFKLHPQLWLIKRETLKMTKKIIIQAVLSIDCLNLRIVLLTLTVLHRNHLDQLSDHRVLFQALKELRNFTKMHSKLNNQKNTILNPHQRIIQNQKSSKWIIS